MEAGQQGDGRRTRWWTVFAIFSFLLLERATVLFCFSCWSGYRYFASSFFSLSVILHLLLLKLVENCTLALSSSSWVWYCTCYCWSEKKVCRNDVGLRKECFEKPMMLNWGLVGCLRNFQVVGWIMHRFGQWLDMMMDVGFLCSFLMFFDDRGWWYWL